MSKEKQTWYMLFGDEYAGGYGYWLFDSEQAARSSAKGERSIDERCIGRFPTDRTDDAKKILNETCNQYPEGEEPDWIKLGERIREIGGWNEF